MHWMGVWYANVRVVYSNGDAVDSLKCGVYSDNKEYQK